MSKATHVETARRTDDLLRAHDCYNRGAHKAQDQVLWFDEIGVESGRLVNDFRIAIEFRQQMTAHNRELQANEARRRAEIAKSYAQD